MQVATLGIDLAKNVFRLHGCDAKGKGVLRKQLTRGHLLGFVANPPRCLVAMEACASAHCWTREIEKLGHEVLLIVRRFVKPYVKANKNDASDAEAICEATSRPSMRFVAVKSAAQQDVQAVHRVRQQLVRLIFTITLIGLVDDCLSIRAILIVQFSHPPVFSATKFLWPSQRCRELRFCFCDHRGCFERTPYFSPVLRESAAQR